MSRKLRLPLLVLACVALTSAVAVAQTSSSNTSVTPKTGKTHTRFVVSFVPPASTTAGSRLTSQISYVVSAHMRSRPRGCNSAVSASMSQAVAGSMAHVQLAPHNGHGRWCAGGVFRGQVEEVITPPTCGCPPPLHADIVCPVTNTSGPRLCPLEGARASSPDLQVAPQTIEIGKFSFRVRKRGR
jgi:hypothetical protein